MSCTHLDHDQTFTVHDFGPRGYIGNLTVNLNHELRPGTMMTAVLLTDQDMYFKIWDINNNVLLSFAARLGINELAFNSSQDGKWGTEEKSVKNPWVKNVRATFSVLYDSDGYRIFVNGESVMFYKHRFNAKPSYVEFNHGQVFKFLYHTTFAIIP